MKYDRNYEDIINLSPHVSSKHPRMSLYARSAQFAPFSALTGYEAIIKETARQTNGRIELDDSYKCILDSKLQILKDKISERPKVYITYFLPDLKKNGGEYVTVLEIIRKVDLYNQKIQLFDKTEISINDIIEISGDIFKICE